MTVWQEKLILAELGARKDFNEGIQRGRQKDIKEAMAEIALRLEKLETPL